MSTMPKLVECGEALYASGETGTVTCRGCGTEYDMTMRREWMKERVYGRLVTAREGALLLCRFGLETKQGTIDKWQHRKRLAVKGHDPSAVALYLFDDLVALAAHAAARHAEAATLSG